jgi:hypothetical protein
MSVINYTLKPATTFNGGPCGTDFHPGKPEERDNSRGNPNKALPRSSKRVAPPDDSLLPETPDRMKRLNEDKGAEWCRILREVLTPNETDGKTLLQKYSLAEAATIARTTAPTLHRLIKKFGQLKLHQLTPERLAPVKDGGQKCEWEFLLEHTDVKRKLLELYTATIGASSARAANDRRTAKIATALRNFAYEAECPPALGEKLRAGYQPVPFVNFLRAAVTPEMEAKIRGPKHSQLYGVSSVRDWTCRLPNGDRFEMPAAYTLSMDDMSVNHPFYVEHRQGAGADGENFILSRQGLYALWAKHKVWQSVELVARLRESYTAADILRAFYKMCLALGGVPPFVEFEQSIWKARMIFGFQRDGDWIVEQQHERPGMAKDQMDTISAGLGLCGVKVLYKTKAHQKHIETHFNPLQDILAIVARQYQCIGRYAGEFELPGKQLRRVRAGSHHPRDLKFASQAEMADCIEEAFRRTWQMPSKVRSTDGRSFLSRYDAHWQDLQKVGLLPLNDRLFAACLPGELKKTKITGGYVNVQSRGQQYQFRHEDFAGLGDGYELYYKFDDTAPNQGAAIFNRTSPANSANYRNWKMDEFMFVAARELPGPKLEVTSAPEGVQIETIEERYGTGAVDRGDTIRRKQEKFVSTQFRAMPRPGQPSVRSASARDGRGNVINVERAAATQADGSAAADRLQAPAAALPPRAMHAKPAELPYSLRKILKEAAEAAPA